MAGGSVIAPVDLLLGHLAGAGALLAHSPVEGGRPVAWAPPGVLSPPVLAALARHRDEVVRRLPVLPLTPQQVVTALRGLGLTLRPTLTGTLRIDGGPLSPGLSAALAKVGDELCRALRAEAVIADEAAS